MSGDWYPGIREACSHWHDAPMLQQTFAALEEAVAKENDACIDCAKAIVEVVCRIIVDELDSPTNPIKPKASSPDFGEWVSSAVRVLKLGENRNNKFLKLVSQHHKLTSALGDLRNEAGPVSHGRDGFLDKLTSYHRRSAVLSADGIITFLHHAYLEAELDYVRSREPYERFSYLHEIIDAHVGLLEGDEIVETPTLRFLLPNREEITVTVEVSRLLYQLDREAYVEALNAARSASSNEVADPTTMGDDMEPAD